MPEIRLERARIVAVVGELVTTSVAKHVGMGLDAQLRAKSGPLIIREKPGGESGAPRSETNKKGDFVL